MATPIKASTQEHLDIEDITNNIVIYKTGGAAMALRLSAVNFNLLSAQEQEAIIYSYAGLLNSLSFPVQILIRSQKKDISNYLQVVLAQETRQLNPILKSRLTAYRRFLEKIVKERNVLDKKFYVIIPFSAIELGLKPSSLNPLAKAPQKLPYEKSYIIEKALNSLEPKRDHLMRQFTHLSLNPKQLNTQELIQLFYNIYNPDSEETIQISNTQDFQSSLTEAQNTPLVEKISSTPPSTSSAPLKQKDVLENIASQNNSTPPAMPTQNEPPLTTTPPTPPQSADQNTTTPPTTPPLNPTSHNTPPPATRQPQELFEN